MVGAELKFPVISTGDILREAVREQTELGKQAKGFMNSGALVPDELVDAIVKERLLRKDCAEGFILDGYPRTIKQAEALESAFKGEQFETAVIGIAVDDNILVSRISCRRSCPKCGKVFGAGSLTSPGEQKCDECGTPLIQRKDDTAEVMEERLRVYHRKTQPLIDHYKSLGWYVEIDGDRPVNDVYSSIVEIIKQQLRTAGVL
jgi:adenylate kinase